MSCILSIIGQKLEVDGFVTKSTLRPYKKWHKGEPKFPLKPEGPTKLHSGLAIQVSKSGFEEFDKQVKDALRFLKRNKQKLLHITVTKAIEFSVLDFGTSLRIDNDNVLCQTNYFPKELLKICSELGIGIELSIYSNDMEAVLEKRKGVRNKS